MNILAKFRSMLAPPPAQPAGPFLFVADGRDAMCERSACGRYTIRWRLVGRSMRWVVTAYHLNQPLGEFIGREAGPRARARCREHWLDAQITK